MGCREQNIASTNCTVFLQDRNSAGDSLISCESPAPEDAVEYSDGSIWMGTSRILQGVKPSGLGLEVSDSYFQVGILRRCGTWCIGQI